MGSKDCGEVVGRLDRFGAWQPAYRSPSQVRELFPTAIFRHRWYLLRSWKYTALNPTDRSANTIRNDPSAKLLNASTGFPAKRLSTMTVPGTTPLRFCISNDRELAYLLSRAIAALYFE